MEAPSWKSRYCRQNLMLLACTRSRCDHSAGMRVRRSEDPSAPLAQGPPHTGVQAAVLAPVLRGDIGTQAGGADARVLAQLLVQRCSLLSAGQHLRENEEGGKGQVGRGFYGGTQLLARNKGTRRNYEGWGGSMKGTGARGGCEWGTRARGGL